MVLVRHCESWHLSCCSCSKPNYSNFAERWHLKILIGVTKEPEQIKTYLSKYHGQKETLTEVGPFVARVDALNWLVFLKSRIGNFEEIIPEVHGEQDGVWYGFTFEQETNS